MANSSNALVVDMQYKSSREIKKILICDVWHMNSEYLIGGDHRRQ
jgi:hypothetical protein